MTGAGPPMAEPDGDARPPRVGILIGSLEAGGAQRMALTLAHDLLSDGWEVRLLLLNPDREMALPGDAAMQDALERRLSVLGGSSVRASTLSKSLRFPSLHRRLAAAVAEHRLEVVVSFMERANVLNLLGNRAVPRIVSVRKQISVALADKTALKRALIRHAYPRLLRRAAAIVLNARASAAEFQRRFAVPAGRLTVIPNAVAPEIAERARAAPEGPGAEALDTAAIVSVGRLLPAKGHAPLLRAFTQVRAQCPGARLVIVGNGPLRGRLGALALALGVSDRVYFAGFQANPYPWMAGAGALALPSRAEGFPNALLEAMYLGTACVAADCPSGPRELLAPDTPIEWVATDVEVTGAGILVPPMPDRDLAAEALLTASERALAAGLIQVLTDRPLRRRLQAGAAERARAFTPDRANAAWQKLLADTLPPAPAGAARGRQTADPGTPDA